MPSALHIPAILAIGLAATEGFAWWWMHPASADLHPQVLTYLPSGRVGVPPASESAPPPADSSAFSPIDNRQSTIVSRTPLPEIYHQAAPMLRCSGGQVFHVKLDETTGLHCAFFEWDQADTGSVLEAFRHMPEACMGSIGMKLVSKEKPLSYRIGGETLVFDHTIFREPGSGGGFGFGPLIHAFRAVWVAGMDQSDARKGIGGDEFDRLRTIRVKSAVTRFRPSHARVIQGAVRGASSGQAAWQTFESTMLADLKFVSK